MRVLIIGGTGLISTAITRQLLARGDDVVLFNRGKTKSRTGTVDTIVGDRKNAETFIEAVRSAGPFDAIVDMICFTEADARSLVEAARGTTSQVIFCSTVDVYNKNGDGAPLPEDAALGGLTEYGQEKAVCEKLIEEAAAGAGFEFSIGRPAYTYGEGSGILHMFGWGTEFLDRLSKGKPVIVTGDGTQLWTSTYCDDVAAAFVRMLGNDKAYGQAYNLTGDEWLSWNRYHEKVAEAIGAPPALLVHIPADALWRAIPSKAGLVKFNLQYSNVYDNRLAKRDLGFASTVSFSAGMRRSYDWLVGNGLIHNSDTDSEYDDLLERWNRANAGFYPH